MDDLFEFFDNMNKGNFDYVDTLSDKEVNKLSPYVLLMWCHGAVNNNPVHVFLTDFYCNTYVFSLSKHNRLLLKLFIAANSGFGKTNYRFVKSTTEKESKRIKAISLYYECGIDKAKDYERILPSDDVDEIMKIMEGEI